MSSIGEFEILREIDRGSMGVVYEAQSPEGERFAIKTFSVSSEGNRKESDILHALLIKEGRRAIPLQHPNIVRTYDVLDDDSPDGVGPYIVMEYVDGPNLDKYLAANPEIEPGPALNLLRQAADALDYAASVHGLVHRDVKPANMMITGGGTELKLTDFGIAKRVRDVSSASSSGASISDTHRVGTLRYMAPEQITDPKSVDSRADQYGLANVAYRLLTGRLVFEDKNTDTSLGYAIVNTHPAKPSTYNQRLRRKVDSVMRKAFSKKPDERFPSCRAFVDALDAAVFSEGGGLPAWLPAAAASVAVVGLLVGGLWYLSSHERQGPVVDIDKTDPTFFSKKTDHTFIDDKTDRGGGVVIDRKTEPPPPPPEPKFTLAVLANNNSLPSGLSFKADDEKWGRLGKGDLVASISAGGEVPAGATVTVDWEVNGISYSTKELRRNSFAGKRAAVEYDNTPTTGDYRVRLLVNGKEKQSVAFRIIPES